MDGNFMLRRLENVPAHQLRRALGLSTAAGLIATRNHLGPSKCYATAAKKKPKASKPYLQASTPTAEKLQAANLWSPRAATRKKGSDHRLMDTAEKRRVNVVSEKLCDDAIKVLGPSLQRHQGCDLLDLNPGVGLWSRALHDAIQPRRHIMMDGSYKSYKPFLDEAMGDRKNVEIIPKSGLIWSELEKVLTSHISPHHAVTPKGEQPQRNDMLLISLNISSYPKRNTFSFDSISTMVLYQYLQAIRTTKFFQRYGLVRMLIWVNDENKRRIIPRTVHDRRRAAFEAELCCEWVNEVVGDDRPESTSARRGNRDQWMNYESTANAIRRMQEAGITIPSGRESEMLKEVLADPSLMKGELAGHKPVQINRNYLDELEGLEANDEDMAKETKERRRVLRYRRDTDQQSSLTFLELLQLHESALKMNPSTRKFAAADKDFNNRLDNLKKNHREIFVNLRDSYHIFRHHNQPSLHWDRRPFEPLSAGINEFYPNAPTCLLDIQPKAMDPVLYVNGPGTSRAGDFSNILLRTAFNHPTWDLTRAMDSIWPGFSEMISQCPSFTDASVGGSPLSGHGALTVRSMNDTHWSDLIKAWMDYPFKPTYHHMLGRIADEGNLEEESSVNTGANQGKAMGGGSAM